MKLTYLLPVVVTVFSATVLAEEPTVLFYETFDTQYESHRVLDMTTDTELKANTILGTDAYKIDESYYFDTEEDKLHLINVALIPSSEDYWEQWSELWPGASKGGVGRLVLPYDLNDPRLSYYEPPAYRIKLTTKNFRRAYFSCGFFYIENGFNGGGSMYFDYSFDEGETWHEFSWEDADIIELCCDIFPNNCYKYFSFKENIGGKKVVYLKVKNGLNNPIFDDAKVVGYEPVSISTDETASESLTVCRQGNGIVAAGIPQGKTIAVYNAVGILVASAVANEGETVISLSGKGVYIVKTAGETVKVAL